MNRRSVACVRLVVTRRYSPELLPVPLQGNHRRHAPSHPRPLAGVERPVLDTYAREYGDDGILVRVDETSARQTAEARMPLPAAPGKPAVCDYEYAHDGTANLFMTAAPIEGLRCVKVTDRRTKRDSARILKDMAGIHFPDRKIIPVTADPDTRRLSALGGKALGEVGREDAAELHHGLRATPYMANTAAAVLSKIYRLAESWELAPRGSYPCRSLRRYPEHRRERFLTPEEYRRLGEALREAEAPPWPQAVAAIRLLVLTGCRKNEILTLRWEDVDLGAGELALADAKTGPRAVPLPPSAVRLLAALPRRPSNP